MDYLVTLEAGNWDVVIGLTPASLQMHTRGRQLLERIAYLDTIDDRVHKLWLSDDYGHDSYFLNEHNCDEFAALYLDEYRRLNGFACRTCAHRSRCLGLGTTGDNRLLAPFSRALLRRMFRALPDGKGKARYFVRAMDAVLRGLTSGDASWQTSDDLVKRDYLTRADTQTEAVLTELYGEQFQQSTTVRLDAGVRRFFRLELSHAYETVTLSSRVTPVLHQINTSLQLDEDPERSAIRRWLEGESANRQLLRPLRQGVARWLRLIGAPNLLTREGIAKPKGALRWQKRYLDVSPPILLEDVDEPQEGIAVRREVGLLAFDLAEFALAKGEQSRRLAARIAQDYNAANLVQGARNLRTRLMRQVADQMGMPLSRAAVHLYLFGLCLHEGQPRVPDLPLELRLWLIGEQQRRGAWRAQIDEQVRLNIAYLFEDFFKLRENVYDGPAVSHWCAKCAAGDWLAPIMDLTPERLDRDFLLGNISLAEVIAEVQSMVQRWRQGETFDGVSDAAQLLLLQLSSSGRTGVAFTSVPPEVWAELRDTHPEELAQLRVWRSSDTGSLAR